MSAPHTYTPALIPRARVLRTRMSGAERKMWYECLRDFPYRFRRQRPFGNYILDFYCPSLKLAVEIDGDSHYGDDAQAYDAARSMFLASQGVQVVRFLNRDVLLAFGDVYRALFAVVEARAPSGQIAVSSRFQTTLLQCEQS